MADNRNSVKHRYYNTPGVVDGNLARELNTDELRRRLESSGQLDFDQQYRKRKESQAELIARQRAKAKAMVRPAEKASLLPVIGFISVAVLMVGLLMCYVEINAISGNIVEMKQQISQLEVEQVSLMARYEQAFDTATVKEAAQAAGMSMPSDSQIYYIDLPGQDQAVAYRAEGSGVFSKLLSVVTEAIG